MSNPVEKEYDHVEFTFSRSGGRRNGKSIDVTAFLLIPSDQMAEFTDMRSKISSTNPAERLSGSDVYKTLLTNGALLHNDNGPAYKEVERSLFDRTYAQVILEQHWIKGEPKGSGGPGIRPIGKMKF